MSGWRRAADGFTTTCPLTLEQSDHSHQSPVVDSNSYHKDEEDDGHYTATSATKQPPAANQTNSNDLTLRVEILEEL